ncbi:Major facilitator superfamily MFS_1 [Thiomonas sp. X19]|uniref:YbfB/YjiJ family MFS transporter n=1 Tax=Thiomonas sp. X19 TaxID=1050370 RepID=UPI000B688CF6|nr:YbfB/YjiJ family MFS transporter [Thiomonas sp. X19]SCC93811.1 Major facilitator superfamily MFS_1 [Thiomonas sp. X19]
MRSPLRFALTGMTLLAVALGIGRFLLTPLLPIMQADAGLSLVGGGWLASVNNLGYLAGALLCAVVALPQRQALRWGLVAITLSTAGMGLTHGMVPWLAWRLLAGVAAAVLVVHGIAWSMHRLQASGHPLLEAFVFTGPGVGIVVSGVVVAGMQPLGVSSAASWIGFGLACVLATALIWRTLDSASPAATAHAHVATTATPTGPAWTLIAAYGLIGFGYVIPATFLPVIAGERLHLPALREWFWPLYGAATVVLTLLLPRILQRIDNRRALAGTCVSMILGITLILVWPSIIGLALATVLIGSVLMPIVMVVMREARRLAPHDHTRLIAALTTAFGSGQIVGPLTAAWLAVRLHSFDAPLLLAALTLLAATGLAMVRTQSAIRPVEQGVGEWTPDAADVGSGSCDEP